VAGVAEAGLKNGLGPTGHILFIWSADRRSARHIAWLALSRSSGNVPVEDLRLEHDVDDDLVRGHATSVDGPFGTPGLGRSDDRLGRGGPFFR
jgi:hypothetical protein